MKLLLDDACLDHTLAKSLPVLALDAVPYSLQYVVDGCFWLKARLGTLLEDTGFDKNGVPVSFIGVVVVLVGTTDIRLWGVADKVDSVRCTVNAMCVLAPALKETGGKLEGTDLGLAKGSGLKVPASDGLEHSFERHAQRAHADASEIMRSTPDDIVVGKEDWRTLVEVLRASS